MTTFFKRSLDRLWPQRWRKTPDLPPRGRVILWKQVSPGDAGLRAVVDLLGEVMEQNANVAMDVNKSRKLRLAGADAASVARGLLYAIEDEWRMARAELENETKAT